MPLLLRKLLFAAVLSLFALLVGALLGGTVFASSAGHGLGSLDSMITGAFIGLGTGLGAALVLVLRRASLPWGRWAMGAAVGCALIVGLILLLDALGHW